MLFDAAELGAWLRLVETPGVGRTTARQLLAAFSSPEAVIGASTAARRAVVGHGSAAAALADESPDARALLDATRRWLDGAAESAGATRAVVPIGDARYPRALLESPDPPLLLYAQGRLELLQAEALAIVGSRNPTPQGAENARAFAAHLAGSGLTIVSGLALGIDAAAHTGALDAASASAGGATIAVVGTGLDIVYPRTNLALARRIAAEGLVLSEYPLGTPSRAAHFPQRNRIIAGLARGTLVVEAALKSGSLITARLANEAGREVFAIPGSIHSPLARGCHALIRQGARLVEDAADILEELKLPVQRAPGEAPAPALSSAAAGDANAGAGARLLEALGHDPVTLDALAARTGRSAAELAALLLALELDGQIARLPGQLFQRLVQG